MICGPSPVTVEEHFPGTGLGDPGVAAGGPPLTEDELLTLEMLVTGPRLLPSAVPAITADAAI